MARSVSIACLFVGAGAARADTASVLLSPGVSATHTSETDQAGRSTSRDLTDLTQQYRLTLDQRLYPNLGFSGSASVLRDDVWTRDGSGASARSAQTAGNLSARLGVGTGLLGGALSYDRRQELLPGTGGEWAVGNTYGLTAGWHPLDLPTLDLRLSRADLDDPTTAGGTVTYDGLVALGYTGVRGLDLRYTLRYTDLRQPGTESRSVGQEARGSYRTTFLDDRTTAYASAAISSLWSQTVSDDPAGAVPTQRFPVAGLSAIEDFPDVPGTVALKPNPALVNGDVRSPASVDLGFGVGVADRRPRDLGVQLADVVTKVNRLVVWVDRALPAGVAAALQWEAYRSDDGQHWTPVAVTGAVRFGAVESRFDIPILETSARYLKVVTRPIDPSVTTDARWQSIWVTELQVFDLVPAAELRHLATHVIESFAGTAQTRLLSSPALSHDVSVAVNHPTDGTPTTWLVVNGLSLTHRATGTLTLSGRVAEQEADAGNGRASTVQWSATAAHQPFATITDGLAYSGQVLHGQGRVDVSNSLTGYARAQIYTGIAATANATAGVITSSTGAVSRTTGATVGASAVPNRTLTCAATYGVSAVEGAGGGQPATSQLRHHADATATVSPVPALYGTASVSRTFGDVRPSTVTRVAVNLSPFPDGQLLLRLSAADGYDSAQDARTQSFTPTLRWAFSPRAYLDLAWSDIRTTAPVQKSRIQTASAFLTVTL